MLSNETIYSRGSVKESAVATAEAFIILVMRYPIEERRRFLKTVRSRLMKEGGDFGDFIRGGAFVLKSSSEV